MYDTSEIILLPQDISNRIAAGEVVERPLNVVKELVENAVDAAADFIKIEIKDGGLSLIKVTDNGRGILPDDLPKSIVRFATSKIRDFDDIFTIKTFGFRGEALAAISSVSRFSINSIRDGFRGAELSVSFGEVSGTKPSSAVKGTIVKVESLFEKIPARKKFLKSSSSELREIIRFLKSFAAVNYSISFEIISDDSLTAEYTKSESIVDRVKDVYGGEKYFYFEGKYSGITISGAAGHPDIQKLKKDYITLGVNKRIVKDSYITHAVVQAYKRLMPEQRFPFAVLDIYINPEDLDVNIHPNKTFIKFADNNSVYSLVYDTIKKELSRLTIQNGVDEEKEILSYKSGYQNEIIGDSRVSYAFNIEDEAESVLAYEKSGECNLSNMTSDIKVVGQLFNTFILCEKGEEFFIIDQHIAHERVLYEKFMHSPREFLISYVLIEPLIVMFDKEEIDRLTEHLDLVQNFGFEAEIFGSEYMKITRIPVSMMGRDIVEEFKNILLEIGSYGTTPHNSLALSMSCRLAIKAGDVLNAIDMNKIVMDLFESENPYTCPHGRPIVYRMQKKELFKKFGR